MASHAKTLIVSLLNEAGVQVNGSNPWDIAVHNEDLYGRILRYSSLGLGESYMDGWWDAKELDQFFHKILSAGLDKKVRGNWRFLWFYLSNLIFNQQRRGWKADQVGKEHYDIGNDLYQAMLGPTMAYTCAYWQAPDGQPIKDFDSAQEAKFDLTCRKLRLRAGQKVLDIGGGWGSFARYAATRYGVKVTVINNSQEQFKLGRELCRGLDVEFLLQDYREPIVGVFDHIVSLGMFEHVGYKNYPTFMRIVNEHLKDDGLFLLHTIGSKVSGRMTERWIEKYIFPNSMLPSIAQIAKAAERIFNIEDLHNFGSHYDPTLMSWFRNFDRAWTESLEPSYRARCQGKFYRMWKYYLLSCAGSFRARHVQLWQIVLSKAGVSGGYQSIR